jgi:vanillate O-demethylase ferredoxin subunit
MMLRVRAIFYEAERINAYELVDPSGALLPAFTAGSHIDVHLPGNFLRQYSLANDPREQHRYVIGVLKEVAGRGGSKSFHDNVKVGDLLQASAPRNNFALVPDARSYLLIAGGIGVTPLMSMVTALGNAGADFALHYCARAPEQTAFRDKLAGHAAAGRVTYHYDGGDPRQGLDVAGLLEAHGAGTHLYCCGPAGLMKAVGDAAAHWPPGTVHFEFFAPLPQPQGQVDGEFKVKIASSNSVFAVPADKTILEVLRANGLSVESSCEAGTCGTCCTGYLEGTPDHRDFVLTDDQQAKFLMVCCSRSKSELLVLDL